MCTCGRGGGGSHAVAATAARHPAAAEDAPLLESNARVAEAAYDRPTVQAAATTSKYRYDKHRFRIWSSLAPPKVRKRRSSTVSPRTKYERYYARCMHAIRT